MVVTLIGYRGSGKSSVAAPLGRRLGWNWIDADAEIERRAGRTIRQIFSEQGEPHFRGLERQILAELLGQDRLVVAAGGGAVLNAHMRDEMHAAGPVVWLRASADLLQRRINSDQSTAERRPDLTVSGGHREIVELLAQREPLYRECATVTIETDNLSVDEIVDSVLVSIDPIVRGGSRL